MSTGPYGSEPYIAPEQFLGKPYDERLVDIWAVRDRVLLPAHSRGELSEIVQYLLHTLYRARAGDEENSKWTTANGWCPNAYFYRSQVNSNNTSWHIGSRTAPTPVARAVSPDLVDSDNTSSKIGCSVPTPVACTVSPDLVDSNNTSWKIVGSVPTAVACTVSPDLARAENVDSDNKRYLGDCGQYFLDHQVDEGNTNWTIGNNRRFLLLLELLPTFEWCPPLLLWPLSVIWFI
ncbi:hypothetical protein B0H14DRAFT_2591605 [Mycena olivaceomarginata]|nr:hypothetical protein B0H14DRAFT_2591605 [Mycena olivaceomarginata]